MTPREPHDAHHAHPNRGEASIRNCPRVRYHRRVITWLRPRVITPAPENTLPLRGPPDLKVGNRKAIQFQRRANLPAKVCRPYLSARL